ncbi:MAG: SagB family peptide dehydrogenase [Hyphomicrobiales bacterium]|nr:SagB family peptide dehydrogenase [Hyphomicrobiales bacterium]
MRADGHVVARIDDHRIGLGHVSPAAADRASTLAAGLPLDAFASGHGIDQEIELLVRRLAGHGLVEYCLKNSKGGKDQVVIEPQVPHYWPGAPALHDADRLVLSRFAYLRRRADEIVLESPLAGALFRIGDPRIATALAALSVPQSIKTLRRQAGFPGVTLLALLLDSHILLEVDTADDGGLRPTEGDDDLVLWDFHDLLFHTRSTEGRHTNLLGGVYPYAGVIPPPPAVRPSWPGRRTDLGQLGGNGPASAVATLLRARHSTRSFDDQHAITLAELARFLDGTARVQAHFSSPLEPEDPSGPTIDYAPRPYPSGGGSWELELYIAANRCDGLARGFYHYDADGHALVAIDVDPQELDAALDAAAFAMGAAAAPPILVTIAARFGRVSWKYSALAYALILKDVGVLMQTFYLMATELKIGACALGTANIARFARMTGIPFHVEGPVAQFALGRASEGEQQTD